VRKHLLPLLALILISPGILGAAYGDAFRFNIKAFENGTASFQSAYLVRGELDTFDDEGNLTLLLTDHAGKTLDKIQFRNGFGLSGSGDFNTTSDRSGTVSRSMIRDIWIPQNDSAVRAVLQNRNDDPGVIQDSINLKATFCRADGSCPDFCAGTSLDPDCPLPPSASAVPPATVTAGPSDSTAPVHVTAIPIIFIIAILSYYMYRRQWRMKGEEEITSSFIFIIGVLVLVGIMIIGFYSGLLNVGDQAPDKDEVEGDTEEIIGLLADRAERCWAQANRGRSSKRLDCFKIRVQANEDLSRDMVLPQLESVPDNHFQMEDISADTQTTVKVSFLPTDTPPTIAITRFVVCDPSAGHTCTLSRCGCDTICQIGYDPEEVGTPQTDEYGCVLGDYYRYIEEGESCTYTWECQAGLQCDDGTCIRPEAE
jgi:hypothetical protein